MVEFKDPKRLVQLINEYLDLSQKAIVFARDYWTTEKISEVKPQILRAVSDYRQVPHPVYVDEYKAASDELIGNHLPIFWPDEETHSNADNFKMFLKMDDLHHKISDMILDGNLGVFFEHDIFHISSTIYAPFVYGSWHDYQFGFLHSTPEEEVYAFLDNYFENIFSGLPIINFPFHLLLEMVDAPRQMEGSLMDLTQGVVSTLENRFAYFVASNIGKSGRKLKIINDIPEGFTVDNQASYVSFLYNTTKNACKRLFDFTGFERNPEIRISIESDGINQYVVTSQNFEGPSLYHAAVKGKKLVEDGLGFLLPEGSELRYTQWMENNPHLGFGFEDMQINDLLGALFVSANLKGNDIPGMTSGIGLFGIQNALRHTVFQPEDRPIRYGFTPDYQFNFAVQVV